MIHTVIVPGVGGSNDQHWQSWLQRELIHCSRVQQKDWNQPILSKWVDQLLHTVQQIAEPIQIVAHSFGCLTTVAALNQSNTLKAKVKHLTLVAPANPARFGEAGFARDSQQHYADYFHGLTLSVPTQLIISENDPWLNFEDALLLAQAWNVKPINLGQVGHINVDSGFGAFPEIFDYMLQEKSFFRRMQYRDLHARMHYAI